MTEGYLERLRDEAHQLQKKFERLTAFMGSAVFQEKLDEQERGLLANQHTSMCMYLGALRQRLARAEVKNLGAGEHPVLTWGASRIAQERARQVSEEGWSAEHDDAYTQSELIAAAACYMAVSDPKIPLDPVDIPDVWPWDTKWWKPSEDPIRNLEKAGALIAAEIDRLRRAGGKGVDE